MIHDPTRNVTRSSDLGLESSVQSCRLGTCSFCRVARGGADEYAERIGRTPALDVRAGADQLLVMMDSFPIGHAGGHVLIVPRPHLISLAQFEDEATLAATIEETAAVMEAMFPDHWLLAFEHGPGELAGQRVKCGGCHVDHAHGHILVLPRTVDFLEVQEQVESALNQLNWQLDAQTHASSRPFLELGSITNGRPYLHLGTLGAESRALTYVHAENQAAVPSQLLRRIVSKVTGRSAPIHWNWKIALQQNHQARLEQYRCEATEFQRQFNRFAHSVPSAVLCS